MKSYLEVGFNFIKGAKVALPFHDSIWKLPLIRMNFISAARSLLVCDSQSGELASVIRA